MPLDFRYGSDQRLLDLIADTVKLGAQPSFVARSDYRLAANKPGLVETLGHGGQGRAFQLVASSAQFARLIQENDYDAVIMPLWFWSSGPSVPEDYLPVIMRVAKV